MFPRPISSCLLLRLTSATPQPPPPLSLHASSLPNSPPVLSAVTRVLPGPGYTAPSHPPGLASMTLPQGRRHLRRQGG